MRFARRCGLITAVFGVGIALALGCEQLAALLGVSPQSVSKWENCLTAPDITLLPALAGVFRVSIDELFDYNQRETEQAVMEICRASWEYRESDRLRSREILREGLKHFPGNAVLLNNYLYTLDFESENDEIIRTAGKPIPAIFAEDGEAVFRRIEHEVICEISRESSLVIATGGGCVTQAENYRPLAQNGVLLWLNRDIGSLPTAGRPLSQQHTLTALWEAREPLYRAFSDAVICNTGTPEDTVERLLSAFASIPTTLRT